MFDPLKPPPMGPLWGGVGTFFLAQNESRIYPNMCAKVGCGPTVVSKRGGGVQTDRQTDKENYILMVVEIACAFIHPES